MSSEPLPKPKSKESPISEVSDDDLTAERTSENLAEMPSGPDPEYLPSPTIKIVKSYNEQNVQYLQN